MLDNLKSKYILKKIISNLDQQNKLLLLKCNKKIKNLKLNMVKVN